MEAKTTVQSSTTHAQPTSERHSTHAMPHISAGNRSDQSNREMKKEAIRQYLRLKEEGDFDQSETTELHRLNKDFQIPIQIDYRHIDSAVHHFQIGLSARDRSDFKRLLDLYKKFTLEFYGRINNREVSRLIRSGKKTVEQLVRDGELEAETCRFQIDNLYSRKKRITDKKVDDDSDRDSFYIGRFYDNNGLQHLPKEIRSLIWPNMIEIDVSNAGPTLALLLARHFLKPLDRNEFPSLELYVADRQKYFDDILATKAYRDVDAIKERVIALMFNCEKLDEEPQPMQDLIVDLRGIRTRIDGLVQSENKTHRPLLFLYEYWARCETEKNRSINRLFSLLVQTAESALVNGVILPYIRDELKLTPTMSMFDGIYVTNDHKGDNEFWKSIEEKINQYVSRSKIVFGDPDIGEKYTLPLKDSQLCVKVKKNDHVGMLWQLKSLFSVDPFAKYQIHDDTRIVSDETGVSSIPFDTIFDAKLGIRLRTISAGMSMGKTFWLQEAFKYLLKHSGGKRTLIITNRVSQAFCAKERLSTNEIEWLLYNEDCGNSECSKNRYLCKHNLKKLERSSHSVVQYESLHHLQAILQNIKNRFDFVVIDEFASVIQQTVSTTNKQNININFQTFVQVIRDSQLTILLDDDMFSTQITMQVIKKYLFCDPNEVVHHIYTHRRLRRNVICHDEAGLYYELLSHINLTPKKKFGMIFSSKKELLRVVAWLKRDGKVCETKILDIHADMDRKTERLDQFAKNNRSLTKNYLVVCFTSLVSTGLEVQEKFYSIFCFMSNRIMSIRSENLHQMGGRFRELETGNIYLHEGKLITRHKSIRTLVNKQNALSKAKKIMRKTIITANQRSRADDQDYVPYNTKEWDIVEKNGLTRAKPVGFDNSTIRDTINFLDKRLDEIDIMFQSESSKNRTLQYFVMAVQKGYRIIFQPPTNDETIKQEMATIQEEMKRDEEAKLEELVKEKVYTQSHFSAYEDEFKTYHQKINEDRLKEHCGVMCAEWRDHVHGLAMILPIIHLRKNALETKKKDIRQTLTKQEETEFDLCIALGMFQGSNEFIDLLRSQPIERCQPMLKWREWVAPLKRSYMIHLWQTGRLGLEDIQQTLVSKKTSVKASPDLEIISRFITCLLDVEALKSFSKHMDVYDLELQKEKDRLEKKKNPSAKDDDNFLRLRNMSTEILTDGRTKLDRVILMFDPKKTKPGVKIDSNLLHYVDHFRRLIGDSKKNVTVFRKVVENLGLHLKTFKGRDVSYTIFFRKDFYDLFRYMDYDKIHQRLHVVTREGRMVFHSLYHANPDLSSMARRAIEIDENNTFNENSANMLVSSNEAKDKQLEEKDKKIAELERRLEKLENDKRNRQDDQVKSPSSKRPRTSSPNPQAKKRPRTEATSSLEQVRSKKRRRVNIDKVDFDKPIVVSETDRVKNSMKMMKDYKNSGSTLLERL